MLVTRNDYSLGLMNGDIGIALRIREPALHAGQPETEALRVAFPRNDGKGGIRFVLPSRLPEVETVFAMTVHKSQGSEFEHAVLVLPEARVLPDLPAAGPVRRRDPGAGMGANRISRTVHGDAPRR